MEVNLTIEHCPYKMVNVGGKPQFAVRHCSKAEHFAAEVISALVLPKMRKVIKQYLGEEVPTYFTNCRHQVTVDAEKIAGINRLHILNKLATTTEAYGLEKEIKK
ncbi:unnamed protein product [Hydatigera taeniaeformis]|uniref:DUF4325 domain-containing protein n=1 Tax=Hydatigena taeniaeformis TaxID=6205 RepID=A0A0R3X0B1_HYDTA|nr:unnamed protein product [Hydatigera taeniaeformis]